MKANACRTKEEDGMEEYRIVLESQLGPREGTLQLEGGKEGAVSGWITLVGEKNAVQGRWIGAHLLQLFHHLRKGLINNTISPFDNMIHIGFCIINSFCNLHLVFPCSIHFAFMSSSVLLFTVIPVIYRKQVTLFI